jgi:hypothetical protein
MVPEEVVVVQLVPGARSPMLKDRNEKFTGNLQDVKHGDHYKEDTSISYFFLSVHFTTLLVTSTCRGNPRSSGPDACLLPNTLNKYSFTARSGMAQEAQACISGNQQCADQRDSVHDPGICVLPPCSETPYDEYRKYL